MATASSQDVNSGIISISEQQNSSDEPSPAMVVTKTGGHWKEDE